MPGKEERNSLVEREREKITPNSQLVERVRDKSKITKDKRRKEQLKRWLDEKH